MTIRERIEDNTPKKGVPGYMYTVIRILEEFDARINALEEREHMMIDLNVPFEVASKWRLEQGGHVCPHGDTGCTCARKFN